MTHGAGDEPDPVVRPFILTGGRTRPVDARLRVETLVASNPAALVAPLSLERLRIVRMCQRPLSVAEIANGLAVAIGVVRVLVADLLVDQLVTIHEIPALDDPHRALALLERVRDGVRAL